MAAVWLEKICGSEAHHRWDAENSGGLEPCASTVHQHHQQAPGDWEERASSEPEHALQPEQSEIKHTFTQYELLP